MSSATLEGLVKGAHPKSLGYFGHEPGRSPASAYSPGMARSAASARSLERILRICDSAGDAQALRLQLLDEIRAAVGFDAPARCPAAPPRGAAAITRP